MIKRGIIAFAIVIMAMVGTALAADITIKPDSGPNVDASGTILVPVGVDAATSVGLGVQYTGFVAGNPYDQALTLSGIVVPGTTASGGLPTGTDFVPMHWTPTSGDIGKTFVVNAEATTTSGTRVKNIYVTAQAVPVPEVPTSALMAVGLIGLLSVTRFRRKN